MKIVDVVIWDNFDECDDNAKLFVNSSNVCIAEEIEIINHIRTVLVERGFNPLELVVGYGDPNRPNPQITLRNFTHVYVARVIEIFENESHNIFKNFKIMIRLDS